MDHPSFSFVLGSFVTPLCASLLYTSAETLQTSYSMPFIALARLSVDALSLVTRLVSGEDLMRLYLCGNAQINGLLEMGGVTHVDCASPFECVAYKRGKREKWAGFDLTRPNSFSLSYWRFKRLRFLDLYIRNLNDIIKNPWIAQIESLLTLRVQIGHFESSLSSKSLCLPPNLTSFSLRSHASLGSLHMSFSMLGVAGNSLPASLTYLNLPSTLAIDVASYLPKSIVDLSSPQFLLGKQAAPLCQLPPNLTSLHAHAFSISSLLDVTPRSSSPSHGFISSSTSSTSESSNLTLQDFNGLLRNLLPSTLQTLNLSATSLPDYSVLPITITDLTLHSHVPVTTKVDWKPTQLLVLDLRYSHFSAKVATFEGPEVIHPWYDWIYENRSLAELTLRYSEPSQDDALDTTKLPPILRKLALLGPQQQTSAPRHLPLPNKFPPSLTCLSITVPPTLIKCTNHPDEGRDDAQTTRDLELFPPMKSFKLSAALWHLPHCGPLYASLTHLELDHLSATQLSEISDWPPVLQSLSVSSFWGAAAGDLDVSLVISSLPRTLTSLQLLHRCILLDYVLSWPPKLAYALLPSTLISFNSFAKLPTSLIKLSCTRVSLKMGMPDVVRLKQFCESHPGAALEVDSWVIPGSRVPRHYGSINPVKTLQILWSQPEFADNNLLTILNWSISDD